MTAIIEKTGKGHSLRNSPLTRSDKGAKAPPTSIVMTREEFATRIAECEGQKNIDMDLWRDYKLDKADHGDFKRNLIIEFYAPWVQSYAEIRARELPPCVEEPDVFSWGMIGLMKYLERYDPDKGATFTTVARLRVRGEIQDQLRNQDWVTRLPRNQEKKKLRAEDELRGILKREPNPEELMRHLGLTEVEFEKLVKDANIVSQCSIDEKRYNSSDGPFGRMLSLLDILSDRSAGNPSSQLDTLDSVRVFYKHCNIRERMILTLHYIRGFTLAHIGDLMGISPSRACQLHVLLIERLKYESYGQEELLTCIK